MQPFACPVPAIAIINGVSESLAQPRIDACRIPELIARPQQANVSVVQNVLGILEASEAPA
jgi:hypothetical protein